MSDLTIGRIVRYKPTPQEQLKITGLGCTEQKELPAIVVAVEQKTANLKVLLDGTENLYVKEIGEGKKEGQWSWPPVTTSKKGK